MSYSPEFKKILDQASEIYQQEGEAAAQSFFILECKKLDPWIRINNLYRVRPKVPVPGEKSRMVFFQANKIQKDFWEKRSRRDLVLKSRQQGVTTLAQLIALDKCLFQDGTNTAIIAHKKDSVQTIFQAVKTIFIQFKKDWGHLYPVTTKYDSVSELTINETGSSFRTAMETKGISLDFLHISEAAFVEDKRITESVESVPFSGWVILESTPDTASGLFYDIFDKADKGYESFYKVHFYEWWWQYPEEHDFEHLKIDKQLTLSEKEQVLSKQHNLTEQHILWRRLKITECGSESEFLRQFPEDSRSCFLSGENCVFSTSLLSSMWKNARKPAFIGRLEGVPNITFKEVDTPFETQLGLRIWQKPKPMEQYVIGIDTAEGIGGDASVMQVVAVKSGQQVATYWNNGIDIDNFAAEIYKLGNYYNKAWLVPEINNHGYAVVSHLSGAIGGLSYPNLYKRTTFDEFTQKQTKAIGFKTTSQTKPKIIENLKTALRDGDLLVFDEYTLKELGSFLQNKLTGKMGAKGSAHDDMVMALALAWEYARTLRELRDQSYGYSTFQRSYDPITGFPI